MEAVTRIDDFAGIIEASCEHMPNLLTPLNQVESSDGNEIIRTHRCECGQIVNEVFRLIDTYVS